MRVITSAVIAAVFCAATAMAKEQKAIDVRITTDSGQTLPMFPLKGRTAVSKLYAEATKGEHYRIVVKNRLNRRVGLVIAVDGRNIISGDKSWLKNSERMYILEPYESGEFNGWRSSQERVNRFYFTDAPDSYAAAFGDGSAMGVIAVSAFREKQTYQPPPLLSLAPPRSSHDSIREDKGAASGRTAAPSAVPEMQARKAERAQEHFEKSAGTGYGRDEYSPTRIVEFEAEKRPVHTAYIKYEWRTTLCRMGVISCSQPYRQPYNRLWDNSSYAPPPPRQRM